MADYIKIISVHCSGTGYCYSFHVDTRNSTIREMVLAVCAPLPQQPFRVATDRFYTGVDTAKKLLERGLYMYGTVRTDRGIDASLKSAIATTPLQDGECRWSMAPPHLLCSVWRDTTATGVWFLSTCHDGRKALGEVRRRKRGQAATMKSAPQVAIDYNKFMGGCDRANSLRSSYNTYSTHKGRWYMSMFYYGVDVLLVNAMIYSNCPKAAKDQQSQKQFREEVAKLWAVRAMAGGVRRTSGEGQRKRTPADVLPAERLGATHLPVHTDKRRQCSWCYKTLKLQRQTVYKCSNCDVYLHTDHCFAAYHDPEAQL